MPKVVPSARLASWQSPGGSRLQPLGLTTRTLKEEDAFIPSAEIMSSG